jgi:hypothetical protein
MNFPVRNLASSRNCSPSVAFLFAGRATIVTQKSCGASRLFLDTVIFVAGGGWDTGVVVMDELFVAAPVVLLPVAVLLVPFNTFVALATIIVLLTYVKSP